ncbi:MAG: 6-carboxytetrahydropterin synthase QueD [Bacteroidales bacterium]|nr:6-carboxytetrahydropterin synthase QueD [Bacteroidales bacterium]HOK97539.1 6-carboxytetrahydropterin synthase QueD [Bacteroidales bacterium]HPO64359.1 6-carboxytetrahydropterin synthase QueD [Bacteroidales bacterium]
MKYTVRKTLTFEAAHRLLKDYSGKCTNNHGHSWVVDIELEAEQLDERGMVVDFNELKRLKQWIDDTLDHTTILWEKDPMCEYIRQSQQRLYVTQENPTSEVIARIIFEKAQEMFANDRVKISSVAVHETCTSRAVYKI